MNDDTHNALFKNMEEDLCKENNEFVNLFWQEQKKMFTKKNPKGLLTIEFATINEYNCFSRT